MEALKILDRKKKMPVARDVTAESSKREAALIAPETLKGPQSWKRNKTHPVRSQRQLLLILGSGIH